MNGGNNVRNSFYYLRHPRKNRSKSQRKSDGGGFGNSVVQPLVGCSNNRTSGRVRGGSCISTLRINIPRSFRARASSCRSCRLPVPASDICGVPGVVQGCRALHDGSSTTGAATMRQAKRQMLWCCHAGCLVWSTRLHETVAACASPEAWHPW